LIAPFTGTAILGAWDGKRLAGKVSGPLLQRVFAVVLLAVAAFMLVDALMGATEPGNARFRSRQQVSTIDAGSCDF
jgi:ABC-type nickel/cobalt efflux system permease component RcnA